MYMHPSRVQASNALIDPCIVCCVWHPQVQAMSLARAAAGEHAASGNAASTSTRRTSTSTSTSTNHAGGATGSAGMHSPGDTGPPPHPPPVAQLVRLLWRVLPVEGSHRAPAYAPAVQRGASNRSSGEWLSGKR